MIGRWCGRRGRDLVPLAGTVIEATAITYSTPSGTAATRAISPSMVPAPTPFVRADPRHDSRLLVLYTDVHSPVRTTRRSELLSGAPAALGRPGAIDNPQALALWQLAFACWCWRNVERRGRHELASRSSPRCPPPATGCGPHRTALTIRAARELATGATDLNQGCPGPSARERAAFLAGAFRTLPAEFRTAVLPEAQRKFAFNYGVALHDVERADTLS